MGSASPAAVEPRPALDKILVATDFGASAGAALDHALTLAGALHAKVYVLHAYELPVAAFPGGEFAPRAEIAPRIAAEAQARLSELVASRRERHVDIVPVLKQAEPREAVMSAIGEVRPGLVVVGTHGRRGVARALLGSVAESVVRESPVPVLTVHVPEPER